MRDSLKKCPHALNNRGELENFVISLLENPKKDIITIFLLDLNDFKQINDKYGHVVGDKALRNASSMLRNVCGNMGDRLFLCRYGGDEFVILGRNMDDDAKEKVIANINEAAANCKEEYKIKEDYKIEFGIGMSSGECAAFGDYERILKEADGSMYENKKKMKALRNSNTK